MADVDAQNERKPFALGIKSDYDHPIEGSKTHKSRRWCIYIASFALVVVLALGIVAFVSGFDSGSTGGRKGSAPVVATCGLESGTYEIQSGGVSRSYELHVPKNVAPLAPLVVIWHGIAANPTKMEAKMQWKPASEEAGFIAVYPIGTGVPVGWNGAGCCTSAMLGTTRDDVQFGKDLIMKLSSGENEGCIHKSNVFSTGFSNGGFMSHRMGCQAGDREDNNGERWIKAIAPHSGLIGFDETSACEMEDGAEPMPVISFHGDDDGVVGYDGKGISTLFPDLVWNSFPDTMDLWQTNNGCDLADAVTEKASASTECISFPNNPECPIKYCTISGGLGHNWSGEPALRESRPDDVDATSMIWEFFSEHITA